MGTSTGAIVVTLAREAEMSNHPQGPDRRDESERSRGGVGRSNPWMWVAVAVVSVLVLTPIAYVYFMAVFWP